MDIFYTEDEFNSLRDEIVSIYSENVLKCFSIRKSTYKWSSKHNFIIRISTYSNFREYDKLSPIEKINILKEIIDSTVNFIENNNRNFCFLQIYNSSNFNYEFTFQPMVLKAKSLLEKNNG